MPMRTIGFAPDGAVEVIDQTRLPHELVLVRWATVEDAAVGIETMQVRGAPLIGVSAAHGVSLAMAADPSDASLASAVRRLRGTRPTAVNLGWALDRVEAELDALAPERGRRRRGTSPTGSPTRTSSPAARSVMPDCRCSQARRATATRRCG